jgi:tol-pal system protein YbgF
MASLPHPTGVLAVALLLGACSWYPKERGDRLEQRVERIEGEGPARQPKEGDAAIREQARRVDALVARVEARLEALDAAAQSGGERSTRERELAEEVSRLRAAVEQLSRLRTTVEQLTQRLDGVEKGLAEARRGGGERVAGRHPTELAPGKPTRRETPEAPARVQDKSEYLALAREQERQGQKTVARELYEQYVTQYPTDPTAAEAHFRLGELAFAERRYRDAILEYGRVAKDFPRFDKAPDALLRTGESMLALGLKDEAASVLSEIPRRYPGTPAAARASRRLAELPKASGPASKKRE